MNLPLAVVFGEALTDIVQERPGYWRGHPGGAPWNVARGLSQLGVKTAFAGAISNESLGDEIFRQSAAAGLDPRFVQRVNADPLVAIVASSQPPRYFFAGDADLQFETQQLPEGWLDTAELCHFSCISLARQPLGNHLLAIARKAREAGKRISYDPNWRNLMDQDYLENTYPTMVAMADMIKLSDEDLRHIYPGLAEDQAIVSLRDINPRAQVLFTRGEKGMTLYDGDQEYHQASIRVSVADTVGAGDACMAGWLASGIIGMSEPKQRLRFAAACASVSCSYSGAYAPTLQDVENILTS